MSEHHDMKEEYVFDIDFKIVDFGDMTVEGHADIFLEQFDVLRDGQKVGYVRVKHGSCSVRYPDVSGVAILNYDVSYMGGVFECEAERHVFLGECVAAIRRYEAFGETTPDWRVGLALDAKRGSSLAAEVMDWIKDR